MLRYITNLVWDDFNTKHIKKHNVTVAEVEQALNSSRLILKAYNKRLLVIGETDERRQLTVVVDEYYPNGSYVVTARDTSKNEKKYLITMEVQ